MLTSWQVGLDLGDEEHVDLVLGRGFGGPGAREHPDPPVGILNDLVVVGHTID